jgi:ketosteroid isomerase-like protein
MACYDKDAQIMQPDGPLVHGHASIKKWVAEYFKAFKTHWDKRSTLIWVAGDYGFDQGIDSAVDIPRAGGCTQRYTVKGILIYKRQANGEFKVYRDVWNNNSLPTLTRG